MPAVVLARQNVADCDRFCVHACVLRLAHSLLRALRYFVKAEPLQSVVDDQYFIRALQICERAFAADCAEAVKAKAAKGKDKGKAT